MGVASVRAVLHVVLGHWLLHRHCHRPSGLIHHREAEREDSEPQNPLPSNILVPEVHTRNITTWRGLREYLSRPHYWRYTQVPLMRNWVVHAQATGVTVNHYVRTGWWYVDTYHYLLRFTSTSKDLYLFRTGRGHYEYLRFLANQVLTILLDTYVASYSNYCTSF